MKMNLETKLSLHQYCSTIRDVESSRKHCTPVCVHSEEYLKFKGGSPVYVNIFIFDFLPLKSISNLKEDCRFEELPLRLINTQKCVSDRSEMFLDS